PIPSPPKRGRGVNLSPCHAVSSSPFHLVTSSPFHFGTLPSCRFCKHVRQRDSRLGEGREGGEDAVTDPVPFRAIDGRQRLRIRKIGGFHFACPSRIIGLFTAWTMLKPEPRIFFSEFHLRAHPCRGRGLSHVVGEISKRRTSSRPFATTQPAEKYRPMHSGC